MNDLRQLESSASNDQRQPLPGDEPSQHVLRRPPHESTTQKLSLWQFSHTKLPYSSLEMTWSSFSSCKMASQGQSLTDALDWAITPKATPMMSSPTV